MVICEIKIALNIYYNRDLYRTGFFSYLKFHATARTKIFSEMTVYLKILQHNEIIFDVPNLQRETQVGIYICADILPCESRLFF